MDEGKYQIDNMGPVQGQNIGDHLQITQNFYGPMSMPSSQLHAPMPVPTDRNRQRMLERVRLTWIVGVLDHSLHDVARIALGLHEEPGALANPWRLVVQEVDSPAQPLPTGTRIIEVYDEAGGGLLILGEPGAGKTTLLLELARDLLTRAHADEREPLPVVFNLSSWAQQRAPLDQWLVEELFLRYQVSRTLGQTWVDNDQLLLLLDGLDEVSAAHRGACIQAINSYRQAHPLTPVVVCSRRADYLSQAQQLGLQRAVVVQPLTAQQIDVYLASAGGQVSAVRVALRDDPILQGLATTPMLLNILILTYRGASLNEITEGGSAQTRQEQLFASYVQRMLKRRRAETRYTPEQTTHWLSCLANQMKQHSQTIFYLEQMQPSWLSSDRMLGVYDWLGVRLPGILMGVLVSLMISSFVLGFEGLFLFPTILLGGLLGWRLSEGSPLQRPAVSGGKARSTLGPRLLQWLLIGALIGLASGLLIGLSFGPGVGPLPGLSAQLLYGLLYGLSFGLCSILLQFLLGKNNTPEARSQTPLPARGTIWQYLIRRREIRNGLLVGPLIGLLIGLAGGLSAGLSAGLSYGLLNGLADGLSAGLSTGLSTGVLTVLLIGRSTAVQPTDLLVWSWRGLGKSLFSKSHVSTTVQVTVLIGLSFGLLAGLDRWQAWLSGGLVGLVYGLLYGLSYWLLLGLFQGVSGATIEDQQRVVPNRGIRRSALNGLVFGLISTVIVGLLGWLSGGLSTGLSFEVQRAVVEGLSAGQLFLLFGLVAGLLAGLGAGLLAGLLKGGLASLRHYVVRFLLWRTGAVPWRYVPFLDYAAQRILLSKVGGGYIFIHRLLLEYFASLNNTPRRDEAMAQKQLPKPVS